MNTKTLLYTLSLVCGVVAAQSTAGSGSAALVTQAELQSILNALKTEVKDDPTFAAIFEGIDIDALLKLTPDEVKKTLNDKLFGSDVTSAATSIDLSANTTETTTTSNATETTESSQAGVNVTAPGSGTTGPSGASTSGSVNAPSSGGNVPVPAPSSAMTAVTIVPAVLAVASTAVYFA
ncbi:hypothetical protein Poli38472_010858 [Pythium oligandrum]|uniref:Uncharacterized protein n=1 Tax=Pythium oligandrum TaxID=41045 RepID=A0A8K1CEM7_PYTOL|nr:hypothetical protein Poli38472_010858 [Pythium oligandrum]|eukprot:TMW61795.1 hypothetical protein Poli38472_010858 [Pythium oligandrum]